MSVYAESSAVLAWLLSEERGEEIARRLAAAERVVASDLTLVECDRALVRGVADERFTEVAAADRRLLLESAAASWVVLHLEPDVFDRAKRPFPREPVRTLDALHLALALTARAALPDLEVLSLDRRVRENATALGLVVTPADPTTMAP